MLELRNKKVQQGEAAAKFSVSDLSKEIDVSSRTIYALLKLLNESRETQERIIQAYESY